MAILTGGNGNDTLSGTNDNDTLDGGNGNDTRNPSRLIAQDVEIKYGALGFSTEQNRREP
jgi:Ca2+-binding RTX toxin-like protein